MKVNDKTYWKGRRVFRGKTKAGANQTVIIDAELGTKVSKNWEKPDESIHIDRVSISATIFEGRVCDRNYVSAGQCYDSINPSEFKDADDLQAILDVWREWHLNDMLAGDKTQMLALEKFYEQNPQVKRDYDHSVSFLKSAELHEHDAYKYGSAWLGKPVPQKIINFIKDKIAGDEANYGDW
jgi:hypothetical protein